MTKLPTVDMGAAEEVATAEVEEAGQYLTHIKKMEITTSTELQFAVGVVAEIKEKHETVDAKRREFTDAAQVIIDTANAFFKPALKSLLECEKTIKEKVVDFDTRQGARRHELLGEIGDSSNTAEDRSAMMAEADACIIPKVAGLSLRRSMTVEINDAKAAVEWCIENGRLELLQLNDKAVKALAKVANGHGIDIPGVVVQSSATAAITVSKVERV